MPLDLGQLQLGTDNTPFIGGFNGVDAGGNSLGYGPNSFADVYDTASVGTMRYDALQAVLQKRISGGLEGQLAYTFGKCMTNNSGYYGTYSTNSETTSSYPYWQNLYDRNRTGRVATMIPAGAEAATGLRNGPWGEENLSAMIFLRQSMR